MNGTFPVLFPRLANRSLADRLTTHGSTPPAATVLPPFCHRSATARTLLARVRGKRIEPRIGLEIHLGAHPAPTHRVVSRVLSMAD